MSPQSLPRKQLYTQPQTQQPHQICVCLSWWTPLSTDTKNKALRPRSRKLLTKIEGSCSRSYTVSPCSSAFIYTRRSVTNVFSVTLFLCLGLLLDCLSFSLYSSSASLLPTFGLKFLSQFFFLCLSCFLFPSSYYCRFAQTFNSWPSFVSLFPSLNKNWN